LQSNLKNYRCAAGTEWHSVAQLALNKSEQKVHLRAALGLFTLKTTIKKTKNGDKMMSPLLQFFIPKLVGASH